MVSCPALSGYPVFLTADGRKANVPKPKKFWPCTTITNGIATATTMNSAACRLAPTTDELIITEGIETGLSVRLSSGVPVWAALSAVGMESIVIPDRVRLVIIASDHDVNGKGQAAAYKLCDRLLREDRRVKVILPEEPGDWADAVIAKEGTSHV